MTTPFKNWIGLPTHPTDELVHWTDRSPEQRCEKLREAWDKIAGAGFATELDLLITAAKDYEFAEANYRGED